jgi:hypothetical protein
VAGGAFQFRDLAFFEVEVRSGDEVSDGGGDEHFTGACFGCDAGADVDCEARELSADEFALAGMQAASDLEVELSARVPDCVCAADRSDWPVKATLRRPIRSGLSSG